MATDNDVANEMVLLLKEMTGVITGITSSITEHQQLLLSQRALLLALADSVEDAPQLHARYLDVLREQERLTGFSIPEIQFGR